MNDLLQGVRAKVERAEENIVILNNEITAFLSRDPKPHQIVGR